MPQQSKHLFAAVPTADEVTKAHERIHGYVHRTPLLSSAAINQLIGANIFFKCENFQKVGAFKSRGAVNAVFSATAEQIQHGVCTHSSGNHAQALARAAKLRGIPSRIVMPETAPKVKVSAVKGYGGQIVFCAPTLSDREATLKGVMAETGAFEVHPYNDLAVITGQATCAKEVYEDSNGSPDVVITPVGGGGLLSGTLASTLAWSPHTKVYGAEPSGADDAYRSLKAGEWIPSINPITIADGLLTSLGSNTWPIIRDHVSGILTADETYIVQAMRLIWERMKLVTEPSAAVPLAALLQLRGERRFQPFQNKHIVIILSGGNLDPDRIPWNQS